MTKQFKSFQVIDSCVGNPEKLVNEARGLEFVAQSFKDKGKANLISSPSIYSGSLKKTFLKATNAKLNFTWADPKVGNGTYRKTNINRAKKWGYSFYVHSDYNQKNVFLLYLSDQKECGGGTGLYRHNKTGLEGFHDLKAVESAMTKFKLDLMELVALVEADKRDPSKWTLTDFVQLKFNRLLAYNGKIFHSHIFDSIKTRPNTERLTYLLFDDGSK